MCTYIIYDKREKFNCVNVIMEYLFVLILFSFISSLMAVFSIYFVDRMGGKRRRRKGKKMNIQYNFIL